MAYTSIAAITASIGSSDLIALSDLDNDGAADADIVDAAIEEAEQLINSYGRKRFAASRLAASGVIAALATRMAIRNLRRDRRMFSAADAKAEEIDQKWLDALSRGLVTLETDSNGDSPELAVDKSGERDPSTKNVSRARLKGFW